MYRCIICHKPKEGNEPEKPFCPSCFEIFQLGLAAFSTYGRESGRVAKFVLAKDVLALIWEDRDEEKKVH